MVLHDDAAGEHGVGGAGVDFKHKYYLHSFKYLKYSARFMFAVFIKP